jgi:hypothetical protein
MFDYVNLNKYCPKCKAKYVFQTKDSGKNLNTLKVGDYIDDKYNYIEVIASCNCICEYDSILVICPHCKKEIKDTFTPMRHAKIMLENGRLTNKLKWADGDV